MLDPLPSLFDLPPHLHLLKHYVTNAQNPCYLEDEDSPLAHASSRLRDNRAIVLAAVKVCPSCFRFASARLRGDRETALLAATAEHRYDLKLSLNAYFELVGETLRDDPTFVLEVLRRNVGTKYATEWITGNMSDRLKHDLEFNQQILDCWRQETGAEIGDVPFEGYSCWLGFGMGDDTPFERSN